MLDFGLVKTAAAGAAQSLATIEGVIMGTPVSRRIPGYTVSS